MLPETKEIFQKFQRPGHVNVVEFGSDFKRPLSVLIKKKDLYRNEFLRKYWLFRLVDDESVNDLKENARDPKFFFSQKISQILCVIRVISNFLNNNMEPVYIYIYICAHEPKPIMCWGIDLG